MHMQLLGQARALANPGTRGAPRQSSLRRAVSTAYYALFHYLIDQSCRALLGSNPHQRGFRRSLARAFSHQSMKEACSCFAASALPVSVTKALPKGLDSEYRPDPAIKAIATTFRELQLKRHLADYDLAERFKKSETVAVIHEVESRINGFDRLPGSDDRQFFLVCLLCWEQLRRRA
jgi:uncharacterized protein (UPF0332 family)